MTDTQATFQPTEPLPLPITIDEYMALDHPAEIVNGELIPLSPNQMEHILVARSINRSLDPFVLAGGIGEVFLEAPYILDADERTNWVGDSRIPDISFVSAERWEARVTKYGKSGPLRLAPDLAIEVVSPSDKFSDVLKKVQQYLDYGVLLVIVLDPELRIARICTHENPAGIQLTEADTLTAEPVIPGWSIALTDVFSSKP